MHLCTGYLVAIGRAVVYRLPTLLVQELSASTVNGHPALVATCLSALK